MGAYTTRNISSDEYELLVRTIRAGYIDYTKVIPTGAENPLKKGWYEYNGTIYTRTTDTIVDYTKTYVSKHIHRQNDQLAMILELQANIGCRIGDIVTMTVENIVAKEYKIDQNEVKIPISWRLDLTEQKTKKKRYFDVPVEIKNYIDEYCHRYGITNGRLFTIGKQDVWKHLRAATAYLGLEEVSAHSLRKYAALTVYDTSGMDIAATCNYLNHNNPSTTLLYIKRPPKQIDELLSRCVHLVR